MSLSLLERILIFHSCEGFMWVIQSKMAMPQPGCISYFSASVIKKKITTKSNFQKHEFILVYSSREIRCMAFSGRDGGGIKNLRDHISIPVQRPARGN